MRTGWRAFLRTPSAARTRQGSRAIAYGYDPAGNITSRTYPDGTVASYTFDANERLDTVRTGLRTTDYDYDVAGNLTETAYPNGWKDTRDYDRAGRLDLLETAKAGGVLNSFDYTRDGVGNPVSIASIGLMDQQVQDPESGDWTSAPTPDETTFFSYDALYRLTGACINAACDAGPSEFVSYSYDGVGNRLTETTEASSRSFTYNDADQLTAIDGDASFTYDANGNMTNEGGPLGLNFEYDQAGNRLIEWRLRDGERRQAIYSFDGDGKRLSVEGEARGGGPSAPPNPYEETFLWDPNFGLPMMVASDGTGARSGHTNFTYGLGLISQDSGSGPTFLHPDGIGSVSGVTADDGTPLVRRSYDAFGEQRGTQLLSPGGNVAGASDFGFAGEYQDFNSGLYHLRARQYDPSLGRFISEDPLGATAFSAEYAYVGNRPGVMVDPSGKASEGSGCDVVGETATNYLTFLDAGFEPDSYATGRHDYLGGKCYREGIDTYCQSGVTSVIRESGSYYRTYETVGSLVGISEPPRPLTSGPSKVIRWWRTIHFWNTNTTRVLALVGIPGAAKVLPAMTKVGVVSATYGGIATVVDIQCRQYGY